MGKQESKQGDLGEPVLSWIPYKISEEEAKYRVQEEAEQNAEHLDPKSAEFDVRVQETLQGILADPDHLSFEWETLCEDLTALMDDVNPDSNEWFAEVSNFGWQQLDGTTSFTAATGEELLRAILPKTDCHFRIYRKDDQIAINNAHHDSPCWAEFYYIYPAAECEDCGKVLRLSKLVDHLDGYGNLCDDCFQARPGVPERIDNGAFLFRSLLFRTYREMVKALKKKEEIFEGLAEESVVGIKT